MRCSRPIGSRRTIRGLAGRDLTPLGKITDIMLPD